MPLGGGGVPAPGPCTDSDCNNHGTASGNIPDCSCDCTDGYTGTNCDRPPLASCVPGSTWSSTGDNSLDDCEMCTSHEVLLSQYNNYPGENIDPNYLSYSDILTGFNECTLTEDATISLSTTNGCTRKLYAPRNEPNKIVDGLPELQYYYSSSGTDCTTYQKENLCIADIDCAWNQETNPYHVALLSADMSSIWGLLKTLWDDSGGINLFDGEDSETYVGDGVNGVGCCDTRIKTAQARIDGEDDGYFYDTDYDDWSDDDLLDDYSCIEDQIVVGVDNNGHITNWRAQDIQVLHPSTWEFDEGDSTCSDRQSPIRSVESWNAFIDKKETCKFSQSGFDETLQAFGLEYTPTVKYKCGWDLLMATISLDFGDVSDSGGDGVFSEMASGAGAGVNDTFTTAFTAPSTGLGVADTAINIGLGTSKKKNLKRFAEWYKNAPTNRFMKGRFKKGMSLFSSKCSKGALLIDVILDNMQLIFAKIGQIVYAPLTHLDQCRQNPEMKELITILLYSYYSRDGEIRSKMDSLGFDAPDCSGDGEEWKTCEMIRMWVNDEEWDDFKSTFIIVDDEDTAYMMQRVFIALYYIGVLLDIFSTLRMIMFILSLAEVILGALLVLTGIALAIAAVTLVGYGAYYIVKSNKAESETPEETKKSSQEIIKAEDEPRQKENIQYKLTYSESYIADKAAPGQPPLPAVMIYNESKNTNGPRNLYVYISYATTLYINQARELFGDEIIPDILSDIFETYIHAAPIKYVSSYTYPNGNKIEVLNYDDSKPWQGIPIYNDGGANSSVPQSAIQLTPAYGPSYGCKDQTATNYDQLATMDNGTCIYPLSACNPNPCHNDSLCVEENGNFTCLCGSDYAGDLCENEIPKCRTHTCSNGKIINQDNINCQGNRCTDDFCCQNASTIVEIYNSTASPDNQILPLCNIQDDGTIGPANCLPVTCTAPNIPYPGCIIPPDDIAIARRYNEILAIRGGTSQLTQDEIIERYNEILLEREGESCEDLFRNLITDCSDIDLDDLTSNNLQCCNSVYNINNSLDTCRDYLSSTDGGQGTIVNDIIQAQSRCRNMNYRIDDDGLTNQIIDVMGDSVDDCNITQQEILDNVEATRLLRADYLTHGIDPSNINIENILVDGGPCLIDTNPGTCQNGSCIRTPPAAQPPAPAPPAPVTPPNMCNLDPSHVSFSCDSTRECRDICDNWYCDTSSGYCED